MGLGTANLKAQVRIGGNAAPNPSAVLDLNAGDATTGNRGLVLPRVSLTSNTMQLTTGIPNLTGMMVYNVITTGGAGVGSIGIYVWTGATWTKVNLPTPSDTIPGPKLWWNGSNWTLTNSQWFGVPTRDTLHIWKNTGITWTLILDTILGYNWSQPSNTVGSFVVPGLPANALCTTIERGTMLFATTNAIGWEAPLGANRGSGLPIRCYKPSA